MTLSMVLLIGASPFIGSTTGTGRRSRGLRADWCRAAESRRGRNTRPDLPESKGELGLQRRNKRVERMTENPFRKFLE